MKRSRWDPNLLQWLSLLLTLLLLSRHEKKIQNLQFCVENPSSKHRTCKVGVRKDGFEFCEFWWWRQLNIGTSASPYNERLLEPSKPIRSSHDVSMDYMTGKRHNILCKLRRWLDTSIVLWQYVWMPGKEGLNKKGLIPPKTLVGLWKSSAGKAKMSCYKRAHFLTGHVNEGQLPLSFHKVLQKTYC